MKVYRNLFESIISTENLFAAWDIFKHDKRNKPDVEAFGKDVERELFQLARELRDKTYRPSLYCTFWIHDPKLRRISKATVRDRVLHHAMFRVLNPIFEPTFIYGSFSCRVGKGTHKGVEYLADCLRKVSRNNTSPCFALKCDVRKFFDSMNHKILLDIIKKRVRDEDTLWLIRRIIDSYATSVKIEGGGGEIPSSKKGVPIGNLTSQLFANVYMNELDQFVKHTLKVKNYARYTDDFVILADNREYLESLIPKIENYLRIRLCLSLHPDKVSIRTYRQGVDFLGYVILPGHIAVRSTTKRRIYRKVREQVRRFKIGSTSETTLFSSLNSYLGVLSHADAHEISEDLKNEFWFRMSE